MTGYAPGPLLNLDFALRHADEISDSVTLSPQDRASRLRWTGAGEKVNRPPREQVGGSIGHLVFAPRSIRVRSQGAPHARKRAARTQTEQRPRSHRPKVGARRALACKQFLGSNLHALTTVSAWSVREVPARWGERLRHAPPVQHGARPENFKIALSGPQGALCVNWPLQVQGADLKI